MLRNIFLTIFSQLFRIVPFFITPPKSAPPRAPLVAQMNGSRRLVIVDTDMSIDDVVAILYLLQRPEIDVVGITVVNGVAYVKDGLENLRRLLALAGREDIPVAAGPDKPLAGDNAFPELWRRFMGPGLRVRFPPMSPSPSISAPDLIRQLVADSSAPIQIIALGPMTNIALAFQDDPTLATQLDSIVVAGGTLYVPGIHKDYSANPNKVAEWNLWIDPQASDLVFRSGAKLVVVPRDVTHMQGESPLLISRNLVNEFSATAHWREAKFMNSIMKSLFIGKRDAEFQPLWDAAIVAIAVDPSIGVDWRDLHLQITTGAPEIAGQTVVNETGEPNARVCLGADQSAFEAAYLKVGPEPIPG